jgi:hypothetical protein
MNMVGHRKTLPGFAFEVLIAAHLHGHIAGKAQACFKLRPSKSTVELLANGQVSAALDALQKQGRVQEIPNREKRIRAIAKSYVESPQNTLIVSPDVSVYKDTDREFSAGDRIQFTAPDCHSASPIVISPSLRRSIPMAASWPAWTTIARLSSTAESIATSTTATPSPATARRALPPNASS